MKKYIFITVCAVILLVLAIVGSGIAAAYISPPGNTIPPRAECTVTLPVQPGETVSCRTVVTLPVNMQIARADIAGSDIIPLEVNISGGSYLWNRRVWHIDGKFRILKEGKSEQLFFECALRRIFSSQIKESIRIPLPEIPATIDPAAAPGAELVLAGELLPPQQKNHLFSAHWLWLLLPVLAGALYWFWRKFFRRIVMPAPWERAISGVEKLRSRVKRKKITPEKAFAALCDIVRDYLEIRFAMPAPRRTTQEFMQTILRDISSPLTEDQRSFLHRFLATADMIKFACAASDSAAFDQAATRAGELIRATAEEEKQK